MSLASMSLALMSWALLFLVVTLLSCLVSCRGSIASMRSASMSLSVMSSAVIVTFLAGLDVVAVLLLVALLLPPPQNFPQRLQLVRVLPPGGHLQFRLLDLLAKLGHLPPLLRLYLVVSVYPDL